MIQYPTDDLVQRTAADVHPPLYYLLLKAWVAIWGCSLLALRSLSAVFGVLSVVMVYALSLEACSWARRDRGGVPAVADAGGALFAAFLMAVHQSHMAPSRTARMYSLGVFLAALTAWLLLKALRATHHREAWWSAYGVGVAAFCYTHYYALFTICAQFLFAGGVVLARGRTLGFRQTRSTGPGLLYAATIAGLLYSPWLPVWWRQTQAVHQNFWIQSPSAQELLQVSFIWGTGLEYQGLLAACVWLAFACLLAGWVWWRTGWVSWCLLLQAGLPWALSLGLSAWSGRSIFLDRYLVFAHVSYLTLLGLAWCSLPGIAERLLLVCWAGVPCLYGSALALDSPTRPPAVLAAAQFLKVNYQPRDLIAVNGPKAVNILRYYTSQVGLDHVDVRCQLDPFRQDVHSSHAAVLSAEDILWPAESTPTERPQRQWHAGDDTDGGVAPPPGMKVVLMRRFEGEGNTYYSLVLYGPGP